MKIGTMMITAGVVALGLAAWNTPSKAQGPMYDRVNVTLPYSVTIGERTLQPGDYVIQQLRDQGGGSRVLLIYSDNGMKFETSAMTIPALDQNTPEHTSVILHHFGNDYYFDKVWIQGKDYGYEFPVPDSVKAREKERMQPISVAATYSTVQQSDTTTNTTTTTAANNQGTSSAATNQGTSSAATNQGTTSAASNQRTSSAAMNQGTTSAATNQGTTSAATNRGTTSAANNQGTTAQATQSPATTTSTMTAQNRTTSQPSTVQNQSSVAPYDNSAASNATTARSTARNMNDNGADRSMPNTSAGWLMMLLSGGALSGAGLSLRRKR
jgi:hypothetical protein